MADTVTKKQRSWNMSRIKSRNTSPEKIVKNLLNILGCEYKTNSKKLPGKPDIVIEDKKKIIFINGCFWHQHKGCKRCSMPKTNIIYWKNKLKRNVEIQKKNIKLLKKLGWKPKIIWECETRNLMKLVLKLKRFL